MFKYLTNNENKTNTNYKMTNISPNASKANKNNLSPSINMKRAGLIS